MLVTVAALGCMALAWWQWSRFQSSAGTFRSNIVGYIEFCYIVEGACRLVDPDGTVHAFGVGDHFIMPEGWTGHWEVDEFVKKSSVIQYSSQALARDADMVTTIARHEGLWAHAMSVEMRKNLLDTGNVYGIEGGDGAGRAAGDGGADA